MASTNRYALFGLALAGIFPFCINGLVNSFIYQDPYLYWGFEVLIWLIIPSLILFIVLRRPDVNFASLGFHSSLMGYRSTLLTTIMCLAFAPICYWAYSTSIDFFALHLPAGGFFHYEDVIPSQGMLRLLVIAYFALSAGLVEEFLFRGLLSQAAARFHHSGFIFLLLSPILFSVVHWESGLSNLAATYAYGWFSAVAYLCLRNIWPLIIGHVYTDLWWFS